MAVKHKETGREIQALVLDFDGTFYLNTKDLVEKIWQPIREELVEKIFEKQGKSRSQISEIEFEIKLNEYVAAGLKNGWRNAFVNLGGDSQEFSDVIARAEKAAFLTFDKELTSFIQKIVQELPVYIFTGSSREKVLAALEVLIGTLAEEFSNKLLAMDDMEKGHKPNPEAYQEMLRRLELNPETTAFADDTLAEVDTAKSFGILTFLVGDTELEENSPHIAISSLPELLDHLVIE